MPLADVGGVPGHLVQMEGERSEIVKELGVQRPAPERAHEPGADDTCAGFCNAVPQQDATLGATVLHHDIGQALVRRGEGTIVRSHSRGEPALVDSATMGAESVIVIRMQFQPPARDTE